MNLPKRFNDQENKKSNPIKKQSSKIDFGENEDFWIDCEEYIYK
jgi:hypothetical protein